VQRLVVWSLLMCYDTSIKSLVNRAVLNEVQHDITVNLA